jgi:hypothetical protein
MGREIESRQGKKLSLLTPESNSTEIARRLLPLQGVQRHWRHLGGRQTLGPRSGSRALFPYYEQRTYMAI